MARAEAGSRRPCSWSRKIRKVMCTYRCHTRDTWDDPRYIQPFRNVVIARPRAGACSLQFRRTRYIPESSIHSFLRKSANMHVLALSTHTCIRMGYIHIHNGCICQTFVFSGKLFVSEHSILQQNYIEIQAALSVCSAKDTKKLAHKLCEPAVEHTTDACRPPFSRAIGGL